MHMKIDTRETDLRCHGSCRNKTTHRRGAGAAAKNTIHDTKAWQQIILKKARMRERKINHNYNFMNMLVYRRNFTIETTIRSLQT